MVGLLPDQRFNVDITQKHLLSMEAVFTYLSVLLVGGYMAKIYTSSNMVSTYTGILNVFPLPDCNVQVRTKFHGSKTAERRTCT
jgi:hypothetical protein